MTVENKRHNTLVLMQAKDNHSDLIVMIFFTSLIVAPLVKVKDLYRQKTSGGSRNVKVYNILVVFNEFSCV